MRRRRRLLPALVCVCLAAFACTKDSAEPGASESEPPILEAAPPPEQADQPAKPANLYEPQLPSTLLEPAKDGYELLVVGEAPLEVLRFVPTPGQVEGIELTMTMRMQITGPGIAPIVQNLPPLRQVNAAQTLSVSDGRIEEKIVFERFSVDGAGANAELAAMMKATIEQIGGFEQVLMFDDRGGVIEGELKIAEGTSPQLVQTFETMRQNFEQVLVRFPVPGVGVGAMWRETRKLENNGIEIEQTSQFELVAREGDLLTLDMQSTQRPLTDKFTPPNKPGGEVSLLHFDLRGGGRVVYELAKLMPISVQTKVATELTIEASIAGRSQQLTTKIDIELHLQRLN